MQLGQDVTDSELKERMDSQYVNKCCTLIYTVRPSYCPVTPYSSIDSLIHYLIMAFTP